MGQDFQGTDSENPVFCVKPRPNSDLCRLSSSLMAREERGAVGMGLAIVVMILVIGALSYMTSIGGQVARVQRLATEKSGRMRLLNWGLTAVQNRETLIRSATAGPSGDSLLRACLSGNASSCGVGHNVALLRRSDGAVLSSTVPRDFMFNSMGGFCTGRDPGGAGVGECTLSLVVTYGLNGSELVFDASVYPRSSTVSDVDYGLLLSTSAQILAYNNNLGSAEKDFLTERRVRRDYRLFWTGLSGVIAPKCYPSPMVIPTGKGENASMFCGNFLLRDATGGSCPPGQALSGVSPTGAATCSAL